jgi:HAD superfamily hydrolase (TIGR01549 family)
MIKAVGFDLFGTLIKATADNDTCLQGIYSCLRSNGVTVTYEIFVETYRTTRKLQRQTSQVLHKEVTNSEAVCETIRLLGHDLEPTSRVVREAVKAYFQPWRIELADGARSTLEALRPFVKLGLVSNFTDVSFIEETLRILEIHYFFDSITISAGCGWRKPSPKIFQILLEKLDIKPEECLFVGDEVDSDIKGPKTVGMRTVLLSSQVALSHESVYGADFVIGSLKEMLPIVKGLL